VNRVVVALSAAVLAGGLAAQQPTPNAPKARPTAPPAGKQQAGEPQKLTGTVQLRPKPGSNKRAVTYGAAPQAGTTRATPTQPGGTYATPEATVTPLPPVNYVLGIYGYEAGDGIALLGAATVRDFDAGGQMRRPALEVFLDFHGTGQYVPGRLDAGDKIMSVDGYLVRTLPELAAAVQQAPNKAAIDLDVIDYFTKAVVRARVRAARTH
jgi:hypothetical protein